MLVSAASILVWTLAVSIAPNGGPTDGPALLAQAFEVPADDAASPPPKPRKKKKKPGVPRNGRGTAKGADKPIRTEDDLWSVPDEPADGADAVPDVEEVAPDAVEDVGDGARKPKQPDGQLGGWGADVQRDSWGDEHRLDPGPDAGEPTDEPGVARPPDDVKSGSTQPDAKRADAVGPGSTQPDGKQPEAGTPAGAQPDDGTADDAEPGADTAEPGSLEQIRPPSGSPADLALLSEQRRIHLEQHDLDLAAQDLERIVDLAKELAVPNHVLQAHVLIREADLAAKREDADAAGRLLETAVALAPDLPTAHLALARFRFGEDPLALGAVFSGLRDGAAAALRHPLLRNRLVVNLVLTLLVGLMLAAILFTIVQLVRYLKLFLHDFHHLFPRGVALFQTAILGVLIILLPVFFRAGLVIILLTWLLVAWIYQNWRERAVTLVVMAFLASAPFALELAVTRMDRPLGPYGDVVEVVFGPGRPDAVRRLKARLAEEPDNHVLLASLGSFYKRTGQLEQAEDYYRRSVKSQPNSVVLLNNLGNVLFLKDDLKAARSYYERATKVGPDVVEPYFNLSRAFFRSANLEKGKQTANQAVLLDQQRVRALRELADTQMANYAVADLRLPADWLTRVDGRAGARVDRAVERLWRISAGTRSFEAHWIVGGVALVLFGLMLLLRAKLFISNGCVRCGRPACRRCTPELRDDSTCGQCFHTFVKKTQVDAKSRISKEIQIRHFRRRHETFARGISFVLPGLGQLFKGKTLRGALILTVFCLVLVQVLVGDFFMRDPVTLGGGRNWLLLVPLLVIFAGFYAWAILDAFRSDGF